MTRVPHIDQLGPLLRELLQGDRLIIPEMRNDHMLAGLFGDRHGLEVVTLTVTGLMTLSLTFPDDSSHVLHSSTFRIQHTLHVVT